MVKTAGFTFASRLFGAILSFVMIILVSRWLGPEVRGICGLYLVIITITTAISDIAGGATAPYLLNYYPALKLLSGQMIWAILPAVFVPLVFVLLTDVSVEEFLLLAVAGWLNSAWSIQQQILVGFKKFSAFNLMTVVIPALSLGTFTLLHFLGYRSSLFYLISIGLAFFVAFLSGLYLLKKELQHQGIIHLRKGNREIFQKGFQNQLAHLVSLLNSRLIFFILPAASLGLWSNTLSLGEALFLIPGSLGQVAYGLMASQNGKLHESGVFQKAWRANFIVIIPCLVMAAWMPDRFWQWIFGPDFSGMQGLLRLIIPGIGLYSIYLLISYCQSASGKFQYNFYALLAGLSVNLLASGIMLLLGKYSLNGGIIALAAGWGIASLGSLFTLRLTNPLVFRSFFSLSVRPEKR